MQALIDFDFWLFTTINSLTIFGEDNLLTRAFQLLTLLGDQKIFIPAIVLVSLLLFGRRWWRAALQVTVAMCITGILVFTLKTGVDRPRPTLAGGLCSNAPTAAEAPTDADASLINTAHAAPPPVHTAVATASGFVAPPPLHPVTLRTVRTCGMSFPSGHTAASFTWILSFALLLGGRRRKAVFAGAVTLAVLAGLSRIVLGVHYPLDVLFGSMIGIGAAVAGARLVNHRLFAPTPDPADEQPALAEV